MLPDSTSATPRSATTARQSRDSSTLLQGPVEGQEGGGAGQGRADVRRRFGQSL